MVTKLARWRLPVLLLVVCGGLLGCNRNPFTPKVSGVMTGPGVGLSGEEGGYFSVTGVISIVYPEDRPTVRFGVVESGATEQTIDSWTIPWVIIDRAGTNELFESISGSTRTSEQELRLVEVELDLGDADESVAGDQPQLLQWAVDCSTAPAVVRYFRFGPEEIDLSQGSLFLLERDEEEKMVLEQRAWKGDFQLSLSGKETGLVRLPVVDRAQDISASILAELGY